MALTDPTRIRTTISVDREVHDIFVAMAKAGGMSVSRCMGEWLADTADGAQFVAQKMMAARQAPMEVMREMQAMSAGLTETVDKVMSDMRAAKMPAQRRPLQRAPASGGRGLAPSSLTGLKSPNIPTKPPLKASRKGAK